MTCLEDSLRPEYSPHTEVLGAEFCFPCWDVCLGPSGGCGEPPRDAWGWEPSSSSPSRAVPCLWLAPRSPQPPAPSPAAAPLGWAGRSVPGQPRGQLHAFSGHVSLWAASKAACKHAASFGPQCSVGSGAHGTGRHGHFSCWQTRSCCQRVA